MPLRSLSATAVVFLAVFPLSASAQFRGGISSEAQSAINSLGGTPAQEMAIPVLLGVGLSDLTKNFGDPRGGGTRSHEGLDILAPSGTPIAAPVEQVVTSFGDGASSGLYVRATGAGGESYVYMHLSALASGLLRGQVLKQGDVLGFVGNSGNASGGPAHLHFEIRRNRAPTDPYPRVTKTFTAEQKTQSLAQAMQKGGTAATIVSKHRVELLDLRSRGLTLPSEIATLLDTALPSTIPPPPSSGPSPHDAQVVFGETNPKVAALQLFLIETSSGPQAQYLKNSGATGYFGSVTRLALIEYQKATNLAQTGVVDDVTYAHIFTLGSEGDSSGTEDDGGQPEAAQVYAFTRDLEYKMKGEDVRQLQLYLNSRGYIISASGDGSPGNETTYFGALTRAALIRYQKEHGISPAAGYFGPKTRASLK